MRARWSFVFVVATTLVLTLASTAQTVSWQVGDVFIAVGNSYQVWRNGTLLETFDVLGPDAIWSNGARAGGCAFDSQFNFYATDAINFWPQKGKVIQYSGAPHTPGKPQVVGSPLLTGVASESIVFDASGHFYVGSPNPFVLQYTPMLPPAPDGSTFPGSISYPSAPTKVPTVLEADQIDLGTDQKSLFFGSSSAPLWTFSSTITGVDLTSGTNIFSTTPNDKTHAWAVRLIPPADIYPGTATAPAVPFTPVHGMLVADDSSVLKLMFSTSGTTTTTLAQTEGSFRFLALDPDGISVWAGDYVSGQVLKLPIAGGAATATIATGAANSLGGVCVFGGQQLNIVPLQFPVSTGTVTQTAAFGDPEINASGQPTLEANGQTDSVDYHTWTAAVGSISSAFTLVVSATGQGNQIPASVIDAATQPLPLLQRFDEYFCAQAEPVFSDFPCSSVFPSTGPSLVPIPYTDQMVGNYGIPTVTGSGTQLEKGNNVVYRIENPPVFCSAPGSPAGCVYSGSFSARIGLFQPPVCNTITAPLISPTLTGTVNPTTFPNCYVPPECTSNGSNVFVNNPRFLRDPSEPPPADAALYHQFAFDVTNSYSSDIFVGGGGGRNDHIVADRCPSSNGSSCIASVKFISPFSFPEKEPPEFKIGSIVPVQIFINNCDNKPVLNAVTPPNDITVSVTGPQGQVEPTECLPFPPFFPATECPPGMFFKQFLPGFYAGLLDTSGYAPGLTTICTTSVSSVTTGTSTASSQFIPACTTVDLVTKSY
jgi:hypothetical protein